MPQVLRSDLDLTWAPSPGIAIVTAVIVLPQISPDSFIDGQTGACQRLPAFSLALSVSLSRRPPWAASDCMFAAAPSAAAARRAGVSDALVLSWALAKSCADGQTGAVQRRKSISLASLPQRAVAAAVLVLRALACRLAYIGAR